MTRFLAGRQRIAIWGAGAVGQGWARRLSARSIEVSHFVEVDPRKLGKRIHGARVITADDVGELAGTFLLVAVAAPGGREEIRSRLQAAGFVDGRDFVCVA